MLTLSLVFEDRDRDGLLTDYRRFDLDTETALQFCASMCGDDDLDEDLRWALIGFIARHRPEVINTPASGDGPGIDQVF